MKSPDLYLDVTEWPVHLGHVASLLQSQNRDKQTPMANLESLTPLL